MAQGNGERRDEILSQQFSAPLKSRGHLFPSSTRGQQEHVPFNAGPQCACEQMDEDLAKL